MLQSVGSFLYTKSYKKLITFIAYQNFVVEKHDYDNNQKLQTAGFLRQPRKIKVFFSV